MTSMVVGSDQVWASACISLSEMTRATSRALWSEAT